ncbi:metallophosphoesterase [Clostridium felsineum]|uniref:metallophosphoesterase n=1 Tax=Clostridium felsineum TaxID=36839 RepID=UPI00098CB530|nr:metallophosphoesterase [Clostridium felsineum]MCR3758814.1 metallophosphoesterase [Clostridium felsineum]URZ01784.1 3',5'-cyclic adenosine monophosphate phosphodiesterase CpdA [Clostridium felsineum]URZ17676.1 3',5'-cyclic adenosine monophosphate phosphodiesterase CpdA [Clostridium felsineum DSM 794]
MGLYAISDLHLAFNLNKPMNIFGEDWSNHDEKIKKNWIDKIKEEDTVLIAGDISWSMDMENGEEDLNWIDSLPGKKIICKGNHDYWWKSITKLNNMYSTISFLQNNFFQYEDYAICGTRGWIDKSFDNFDEHDKKIYKREIIRLRLSIDAAVKKGYSKIIVMFHYPPFKDESSLSEFTEVLEEYNVEKVVYGHIHGPALKNVQGRISKNNIEYILTSCDYIKFNPIKII